MDRLIEALKKRASGVVDAGRKFISENPSPYSAINRYIAPKASQAVNDFGDFVESSIRPTVSPIPSSTPKIDTVRNAAGIYAGQATKSIPKAIYSATKISPPAQLGRSLERVYQKNFTPISSSENLSDLNKSLSGIGYSLFAPATALGGGIGVGINAIQNALAKRSLLSGAGEAFRGGLEQSAPIAPISHINPLFRNTLNKQYGDISVTTGDLYSRAGKAAIREGIEGFATGGMRDLKEGETRLKNALNDAIFGAAFGAGGQLTTDMLSLGSKRVREVIQEVRDSLNIEQKKKFDNIPVGTMDINPDGTRKFVPLKKFASTIDVPKEESGLRKTRPGSYTNVQEIDNPLISASKNAEISNNRTRLQQELTQQSPQQKLQMQESQVSAPKDSLSQISEQGRLKVQQSGGISQNVPSLENIAKQGSDVKSKVNIIDYLRTPTKVLEKIGLGKEAKLLKQKYDDYLKELSIEINKVTEWSKRANAPDASERIFKYLDGQDVQLSDTERAVTGEIQTYLKKWADRLGLPEDKRIASYITHIFDEDFIKKEFDPDIAKLITDRVPGSVYDPFLEKRLGQTGYKEDAWAALDAYIKRGVRKFHMDQALGPLKKAAENLDVESYKYVEKLGARINLRPSEVDNLIDNTVKSVVGYKFGARPTARITRGIRQMVYRGTLGLNVGSAIKNLTQGVNTYAELGEQYLVKGYKELATNWKSGELEDVGVLGDNFIQDRTINATKKFWENLDKGLFSLFETAEKINRGSAYYGAKSKYLSQGLPEEEAIKKAVALVEKTQFRFGSIDTPLALQSDIAKFVTQFQSFNVKQAEYLGEKIKNKEVAGLIRYALASFVVAKTVGQVTGTDIKDFIPFFGVLTGDTKLGETPPIKLGKEIVSASVNAPDKYGQERSGIQKGLDVLNATVPFVPGGVQARKTIRGLYNVGQGAKRTKAGNIRYPIRQSIGNYVQAATLGDTNLPEARDYYKKVDAKKSEDSIVSDLKKGKMELGQDNKTAANAIYRYITDLPKEQRQSAYDKIKPSVSEEAKKELQAIIKLENEGINRKDRDLMIIPSEIRARSIYERIMDLDKKNRQKKYDQLVELGIINDTVKAELQRIIKEENK